MTPRRYARLAATLLLGACEFGEITIPAEDPIVVVQAVMRPDRSHQWILVEQTLTGTVVVDSNRIEIPGDAPRLPLRGAVVDVVNRTFPADPCGVTSFIERAGADATPGVYWGPPDCPTMRPGDTLALVVRAPHGTTVRGTTEVPGVEAFTLGIGGDPVVMPGPELLLNRDADTLRAAARASVGRALQLEVRRTEVGGGTTPGFWFVVDSMAMTVPGDLPDLFTGFREDTSGIPDEFPPVFAAGRRYQVTIGVADSRYFDFVRSGNIPPSGRGFVNRLEGGIGVFGSMVAATSAVRVVGLVDDDREGTYRLSGELRGVPVAVGLEMYVARAGADSSDLSSFVAGTWVDGAIDESADGGVIGTSLTLTIVQQVPAQPDSLAAYIVTGPLGAAATTVQVYDEQLELIGALELRRLGPP
jgi:hypothetical protein